MWVCTLFQVSTHIFMQLYRSNFSIKCFKVNISGTDGPIYIKFTGLIQEVIESLNINFPVDQKFLQNVIKF